MHEPEPPPLGGPVDSDPTPSQPPHHDSVGRSEGGPGYPRHRDYSGFHHGGTDGLIRVELGGRVGEQGGTTGRERFEQAP